MSSLLLCRTFPPMVGGIERYVSDLFRRSELRVHAVAPAVQGAAAFDATLPFPVSRYPFNETHWGTGKRPLVPMGVAAARLIRKSAPRIVFSDQVQSGAVGVPIAALAHAAHVVFAYGMELTPRRLFRLKRWVFQQSSAVIAISRFTRDQLASVYDVPLERITLARPGVDLERFRPRPRMMSAAVGDDSLTILMVGRLAAGQPYKGYDRVIRLLARLRAEFPGLRLTVVGEGDDRVRLERLTRDLGLGERVTFLGAVSDAHLPCIYNEADLFVLASGAPETDSCWVEGYGIVYAEAAASGLPSVAYRLGGATDAVADGVTGVLTDPNEEALYAAVRQLLHDDAFRERLGRAAREHALRILGWDSAVQALRNLATRLTGAGPVNTLLPPTSQAGA